MDDRIRPTVREVTWDLLRTLGMTTVFGNPGSTELPMFQGFPADFRYVLGLHESVALAMADGHALATRNAAFVNLHSAAGVGHAMGSLFTAYRNRAPLVVVAGQQARSLLSGEPYLFNDDAAAFPRPYVKWSREPARAADVPAAIARAYHLAMAPPRGPVLVSVPADDWAAPAEPLAPRAVSTALRADADLIEEVGRALSVAARPVFVAGAPVDQERAFADVVALAELHRAPVWAPPMSSRCGFPEDHPLFAGFLPPHREGIVEKLVGHDLVLSLGAPVFTYHVVGEGPVLPPGTSLFQLTDDPQTAAWTPVGTSVLTSVRAGLRDLLDHLPHASRPDPEPRLRAPRVTADGDGIRQALLMQTLADVRPPDSVIVEEAPSSRPVMCEHLPNTRADSFYTTSSGALGYGLPAAVGMALARPGRRVIAVVGDGSAMYAVQALWSAATLDVPLTTIVVNNGGYATVDRFAERFGIGKTVGTKLPGLDFVGMARAQGCEAHQVERAGELADALRTVLASDRPQLLEVVTTD
ncbi:benzoylformate decarboxylase [Streptomyces sp. NPDC050610]|uniref:benzoylformate decarboxylase n=1 Tax=Streptomyces sp. NPDC050610 TaxID=3157097 RepID=UPI00341B6736